ncbi:NAD(P)H-dependent oxidoreductase [Orbus wheelerorum]|uniref:NAD(P)H-dependent oxidoreductase n=1 Tax=Orbus wheelerorum TaxID=3074111 RepID=UPI00370D3FE6
MALMIVGHPDLANSVANKTIVENLKQKTNDLEIRHIQKLYPDYQINIKEEQQALLRHQSIILQYPMYWYNMPAIQKIWFDHVFTYQFAYGSQGNKLKNKQLLVSLTIGQTEDNFIQQDGNSIIDNLLLPVQKSAQYAQMKYLDPVILYGISAVTGHTKSETVEKALQHSQKLFQAIQKLESNISLSN